jgi:hypothetical protein
MSMLTQQQLLLIQEMCIDGEQRCDQRAANARARNDYRSAAYEMQLKERYGRLKAQMVDDLMHCTGTTRDTIDDLLELARKLRNRHPAGEAEQGSKRAI